MKPEPVIIDGDHAFFDQFPQRQARIRDVGPDEMNGEFLSLGDHDRNRRRVIVWRLPRSMRRAGGQPYLKIPFLAFGDETIENDDKTLLPMINELMYDAAKQYNISTPKPEYLG